MKKIYLGHVIILVAAVTQAGCNDSQPYPYPYSNGYTTNAYYISNGVCVSQAQQQQVDMAYCQNATNNGFTMINGSCTSSAGQVVAPTYCTTNSYGAGYGTQNGAGTAQQCIGTYYQTPPSYGTSQSIQCSGVNCRGYSLYTGSGQQVTCQ